MIIDVVDPTTGQRYIYIADDADDLCDRQNLTGYRLGCRCGGCVNARKRWYRRYRDRVVCPMCGSRVTEDRIA